MPTLSAQCVTAAQSCRAAVSRTINEILERFLPLSDGNIVDAEQIDTCWRIIDG